MSAGTGAGLYVHVPFCARVCPYCDFAVRTGDRDRRRRYVDHLLQETELYASDAWQFDTVYLGGGTPSCIELDELGRMLDALRAGFDLATDTRFFLEANPEDVTASSVAGWKELGIETLSLGIQALNDKGLTFLGRLHDTAAARRSVELAREAAFGTVSLDLIYGLPGQAPDDWRKEMDRALALSPDHVSCYQLTVHAGTRFGAMEKRGTLRQLPSDEQAELFRLTHLHMNAAGMQGYEVSQFAASPEHQSRHNRKYWDHTPYLGIGPAAHSHAGDRRWWNLRKTDAWQERVGAGVRPLGGSELLDARALTLEWLLTGLRTYAGVDLDRVHRHTGIDLRPANSALLERLRSEGKIECHGDRVVPTLEGLAVADSVTAMFEL